MMGWATRIENTAQLADAVNLMCNISVEDYKMYLARRANSIEDEALRVAVRAFSAEFGDALESIHKGVKEHIENGDVPDMCRLDNVDLSAYSGAWHKHIFSDRQSLIELGKATGNLRDKILGLLKALRDEDDGEYSSYSDYSEETESEDEDDFEDEDDDDDDDDGDEPPPSRSKKGDRERRSDAALEPHRPRRPRA
jgi:hypothetical protein